MRPRFLSVHSVHTIIAMALMADMMAIGQETAQAPVAKTAEQEYKNIRVLTGLRADQVILGMHGISAELGVKCVHCHIWAEWDKDGKAPKEAARRMITMVREMNKSYFGGANVVTCYTCHRGNIRPVGTLVLPDTIGLRGLTESAPPLPLLEMPQVSPSYPSPESILSKYVEALGGETAIRKVTSRVIRGKRDLPTGAGGLIPVPADIEIYQMAPNFTATVSKAGTFELSEGFDGNTAWARNMDGSVTVPQPEQRRAKRTADFYESLNVAKNYEKLFVSGIEKVNGHDAYVVVAVPPRDSFEKLYFDTNTGLLLRRWSSMPTNLGVYPYQIDYDDYRKTTSGLMFPFVVRAVPGSPRSETVANSTLQILEVRENVAIDVTRFLRPVPAARR